MPTFKIITLGCKVNQFESDAIGNILIENGWRPAGPKDVADACIINTCTVTGKAAMQSRQAIRHMIRRHPGARVVVTGCYAQTQADDIAKIEGVHDIIGHSFKHKIPNALATQLHERPETAPVKIVRDIRNEHIFKQTPGISVSGRTRAYLKIQDGCDQFCTYCIVPHARGRSRSMPVEDVLDKICAIKRAGYKEVVLTGINLGRYGADLSRRNGGLLELLYVVTSKQLIDRLRLSSIEPMELSDDLIELAAESQVICPHFHVPLQSGDDTILKRMHRPYSRTDFAKRILAIRRYMPDAAVGVDVMVGFPDETDDAFENTRALIESLPVTYLHVFPYSARPGTPAAAFAQQLPSDLIKIRARIMRTLGQRKKTAFYSRAIGKKLNVLIEEKRVTASKLLKGITPNYIPVLIDGPDDLKNTIVPVRITHAWNESLMMGDLCS